MILNLTFVALIFDWNEPLDFFVIGLEPSQFKDLVSRCAKIKNLKPTPPAVGRRPALTFQEKVYVTLIRLRQGLTYQIMQWAIRFSISVIWRAFEEILPILFEAVAPAVHWNQGDVIRIIQHDIKYVVDGFEHKIATPSDKGLESVTYSAKKKQHSFTQLVYCTVDGKICHVSSSFPGSCNDSFIAQTVSNNFKSKLGDGE